MFTPIHCCYRRRSVAFLLLLFIVTVTGYAQRQITGAEQINPTAIEVLLSDGNRMTFDFYGDNIFRLFCDPSGGILREPQANPPARILVNNPRRQPGRLELTENDTLVCIATGKIVVRLNKGTGLFRIIDRKDNRVVVTEAAPVEFAGGKTIVTFKEGPQEYFYGGGVQNGRFSHKGTEIAIENQNSWTDGGVASPTPFYWSTNGYGVMWYTFKKGKYNFGAKEPSIVKLSHDTDYLDLFLMVDHGAVPLLNAFYQLTGNPVLLPKFAFYQGHLNAYNRDYWTENEKGILFEDGKRYKESQKEVPGGIKESLNGEKDNYQFSARAVIDRYKAHDMPLGWLLPNDGYGAGYGQTETLDGNIANLKSLTEYANRNGVEIGLWTQSDLHPKPGISALLQRDIVKEVRDAGVRVLKTDVAWVGAGYSFGLNGIADVAGIMTYYGDNSRPFIISLDGWAGTQRYAGVWSGDQTGGAWEYIRFHIPTYIGSGLSGQPNICSDMDGIFGGKNPVVNTRDFQWKTFTLMELNMDGWGMNEKYPHALGEPAASINRLYLKLKSELIPYTYSIAKEAVDGLPVMRALFLEYPGPYTYGKSTRYQYLYGPYFLVAPVYKATESDAAGNDMRDGIYLPEGEWIDYFTGEKYAGNRIINNFEAPLWKLPVFVKNGAILPVTRPNNHVSQINKGVRIYEVYPAGHTFFTEYDDDGTTAEYLSGKGVTTRIESFADAKGNVMLTVHPAKGDFNGFVKEKQTEFRVNVTKRPKSLSARIGKAAVKLKEAASMDEFMTGENMFYYDAAPDLNKFSTKGSSFEQVKIIKNPQLLVKLAAADITAAPVILRLSGFEFNPADRLRKLSGSLAAPEGVHAADSSITAYTLRPSWKEAANADYYEIAFNNMLYSTIRKNALLFEGLEPQTRYDFKIRSVNRDGVSPWREFSLTTANNPMEYAIKGIEAVTTVENQGGSGIEHMFDLDENTMWHTKWGAKAVPFDIIADLKTVNQLDKLEYLPRMGRGNGVLLKGTISFSPDKEQWTEAGTFDWGYNEYLKTFTFSEKPVARYLKIHVTEGRGNYGSGRQFYIYKVPGTAGYLQGDINNDGKIDRNDLTSYLNYTGLRRGDADFEGYISNGDINRNQLIDAYDISAAAVQLDEGIRAGAEMKKDSLAGKLYISVPKQNYDKNEIIEIKVKGENLSGVNAFSFALPYSSDMYEFEGIVPLNLKQLENFTNNRLHTNGVRSLYPTFVNIGNKETLSGSSELFLIKLRARKNLTFNLTVTDGILVDKKLNTIMF